MKGYKTIGARNPLITNVYKLVEQKFKEENLSCRSLNVLIGMT